MHGTNKRGAIVYQRRFDPEVTGAPALCGPDELGSVFNADFSAAAHGMESPN